MTCLISRRFLLIPLTIEICGCCPNIRAWSTVKNVENLFYNLLFICRLSVRANVHIEILIEMRQWNWLTFSGVFPFNSNDIVIYLTTLKDVVEALVSHANEINQFNANKQMLMWINFISNVEVVKLNSNWKPLLHTVAMEWKDKLC